ncbi:MAG: hypothetical protein GEU83_14280 [Pseudonocardiaceae bacterium]|nr:hypothetical protein [Pseudonocardiaceae bacterium]
MSASISEIGRRVCKAGLIGVPLLLPVGLVLWLLWLVVSLLSDDGVSWSPLLWIWGALFFLSAILGMFGGHWNRRIANWWYSRGRDAPRVSLILIMSATVPIAAFLVMATRMRSDGVPGWLWVLAGLTVVLGIATNADQFRSTGRGGAVPTERRQPHD